MNTIRFSRFIDLCVLCKFPNANKTMTSFTNKLSWSISRAETFDYCKRKYYLSYYEYWDGWNAKASDRKKLIYFLKQKSFVINWVGKVVHNAIKYAIQQGVHVDKDFVAVSLRKRLQADFDKSMQFTLANAKPKDPWLYEHYRQWPVDFPRELELADAYLQSFFKGQYYEEIVAARMRGDLVYLDEDDIEKMLFQMGTIPVYAIPDLCFRREDGSYVLLDWKTGKKKGEELSPQLKLYGVRLDTVDGIRLTDTKVEAASVFLASGETVGRALTMEDLEYMQDFAVQSFEHMKTNLIDVKNNVPLPEGEFPMTESIAKCAYCVFQEICMDERG